MKVKLCELNHRVRKSATTARSSKQRMHDRLLRAHVNHVLVAFMQPARCGSFLSARTVASRFQPGVHHDVLCGAAAANVTVVCFRLLRMLYVYICFAYHKVMTCNTCPSRNYVAHSNNRGKTPRKAAPSSPITNHYPSQPCFPSHCRRLGGEGRQDGQAWKSPTVRQTQSAKILAQVYPRADRHVIESAVKSSSSSLIEKARSLRIVTRGEGT